MCLPWLDRELTCVTYTYVKECRYSSSVQKPPAFISSLTSRYSRIFSLPRISSCTINRETLCSLHPRNHPRARLAWLVESSNALRLVIMWAVLIAYQGIANGSPWVVPSWGPSWEEISPPPLMSSLEGLLYVLMIYKAISLQVILVLCIATTLFIWLKALVASIHRIPSAPSSLIKVVRTSLIYRKFCLQMVKKVQLWAIALVNRK